MATIIVTAFDAAGARLGSVGELAVTPGTTQYVATSHTGGIIPDAAASVRLTSEQPIAAFEVFEVLNGKGRAAAPARTPQDERFLGVELGGSGDGSFLNVYAIAKRDDGSNTSIATAVDRQGLLFDHHVLATTQFVLRNETPFTTQVYSCGGYSSPNNPYPCSNGGNCTWWAWYMSHNSWQMPPPSSPTWGNAKSWASNARIAGYFVLTGIPAPSTIGVNTWQTSSAGTTGHVAWVLQVSGSWVYVSEMYYGVYGRYYKWRPISYFDGGYIFPKSNAPAPIISWIYPNSPWASDYDQDVNVMGYNFTAPEMVQVFFPGGGSTVLRGAQIPYYGYNMFTMRITLNARGTWSIRAISSDGKMSNTFYFTVR